MQFCAGAQSPSAYPGLLFWAVAVVQCCSRRCLFVCFVQVTALCNSSIQKEAETGRDRQRLATAYLQQTNNSHA